jgi:hypothetical protein
MATCGSCKNQCLEGMFRVHLQGRKNQQARKSVSSNWQAEAHGNEKKKIQCGSVASLLKFLAR